MAGKKEENTRWHPTTVLIRADILDQARLQKIDIGDVCNHALAVRLGVDYRQQKIPAGTIAEPVIIASNGKHGALNKEPSKPGTPAIPAIINAEDPQAAKTLKSRRFQKEKPAIDVQVTAPLSPPVPEKGDNSHHAPSPITGKAKKNVPKKKKEDTAKKFFTSMIIREDAETALITKDDMYYTFERWCRDHHVLTVPDKKSFSVTLKNQYVVQEKMVNGTPTWVGVRVK